MERAEKALLDLGLTEDEIADAKISAFSSNLKYDKLGDIINSSIILNILF